MKMVLSERMLCKYHVCKFPGQKSNNWEFTCWPEEVEGTYF